MYENKPSQLDQIYDIGYNEVKIGDKCKVTDSQLRPHICWFGEYPFDVDKAYQAMRKADILIVVGTSLQIGYTLSLLAEVDNETEIYFVDPQPTRSLEAYGLKVNYITKSATDGIGNLVNTLLTRATGGAETNV
jgi:NAD-dependent deacetylase